MSFNRLKKIAAAAMIGIVMITAAFAVWAQNRPDPKQVTKTEPQRPLQPEFGKKITPAGQNNLRAKEILNLRGLPPPRCMAYSPDGKTAAVAYWNKSIKVWSLDDKKLKAVIEPNVEVESLSISHDGRTLAWGETEIKLWDVETGKEKGALAGHTKFVHCLLFSSDGKTLASASQDGTVKLWNLATRKTIFTFNFMVNRIVGGSPMAFSPDGEILAAANREWKANGHIKLWHVATGRERASLPISLKGQQGLAKETYAYALLFSPDGKTLASSCNPASIKLWDMKTAELKATLEGRAECMAFSPDSKTIASGADDNTIKLWDGDAGTLEATLRGNASPVKSLVFGSDGRRLFSASSLQTIQLWNLDTGKVEASRKGHRAYAIPRRGGIANSSNWVRLVESPDGKSLASLSVDHTVKLWRTSDLKLKATLGDTKDTFLGLPLSLTFGPKGIVAWYAGTSIYLWDVTKNEKIRIFNGEQQSIDQLAISPDGKMLASASVAPVNPGSPPRIVLWDTNTGMEVAKFEIALPIEGLGGSPFFFRSLGFSPDGRSLTVIKERTILVGANTKQEGSIQLWDVAEKRLKGRYKGLLFAFSPDSKTLACAEKNSITYRRVRSGNIIKTLPAASVRALVFSEDGESLVYLSAPAAKEAAVSKIVVRDIASGEIKSTTPINEAIPEESPALISPDVVFSPDGRLMASASKTPVGRESPPFSDFTIKLWNVKTGKLLTTLEAGRNQIFYLAFSPDSKMLAASTQQIRVWDVSALAK